MSVPNKDRYSFIFFTKVKEHLLKVGRDKEVLVLKPDFQFLLRKKPEIGNIFFSTRCTYGNLASIDCITRWLFKAHYRGGWDGVTSVNEIVHSVLDEIQTSLDEIKVIRL